ncbi:hypothetical protein MRB53_038155 [Persea americana]|nr:hypothetical protein MRB53_038155 [Persea americana]
MMICSTARACLAWPIDGGDSALEKSKDDVVTQDEAPSLPLHYTLTGNDEQAKARLQDVMTLISSSSPPNLVQESTWPASSITVYGRPSTQLADEERGAAVHHIARCALPNADVNCSSALLRGPTIFASPTNIGKRRMQALGDNSEGDSGDAVYSETLAEVYQDATAPFRPNVLSSNPNYDEPDPEPDYTHARLAVCCMPMP